MDSTRQAMALTNLYAELPAVADQVDAARSDIAEAIATEPTNTITVPLRGAAEEAVAAECSRAWVTDNFEETFEQLGVSSERLKIMWESEVKAFTHKVSEESSLPEPVRRTILCFAGALLEHVGGQLPTDWFKVVTLLDILAVRAPIAIQELPATCAALVSIVRKTDVSEFKSWMTQIALRANELAHFLCLPNTAIPDEISIKSVCHQEQQVIGALNWRIEPASCETWISAFSSRFDAALEGSLRPSIQWVWQNSIQYAHRICMWQPASKMVMPHRLAQGIFCISSVMANLVACGCLCPDGVEFENWLQLFKAVQWTRTADMHITDQWLGPLFIATGTDLRTLQEDTHKVLTLINDMGQGQ